MTAGNLKKLINQSPEPVRLFPCSVDIFCFLLIGHIRCFIQKAEISDYRSKWGLDIMSQIYHKIILLLLCPLGLIRPFCKRPLYIRQFVLHTLQLRRQGNGCPFFHKLVNPCYYLIKISFICIQQHMEQQKNKYDYDQRKKKLHISSHHLEIYQISFILTD